MIPTYHSHINPINVKGSDKTMKLREALETYKAERNLSQQDIADCIPVDRTYVSKVMKNGRVPPSWDYGLSNMSPRLKLAIINERTNGWLKDRYDEINHVSGWKEVAIKEFTEAIQAYNRIIICKSTPEERKQVRKELKEASEYALAALAHMEEMELRGELA